MQIDLAHGLATICPPEPTGQDRNAAVGPQVGQHPLIDGALHPGRGQEGYARAEWARCVTKSRFRAPDQGRFVTQLSQRWCLTSACRWVAVAAEQLLVKPS